MAPISEDERASILDRIAKIETNMALHENDFAHAMEKLNDRMELFEQRQDKLEPILVSLGSQLGELVEQRKVEKAVAEQFNKDQAVHTESNKKGFLFGLARKLIEQAQTVLSLGIVGLVGWLVYQFILQGAK
jgi:hypothetical protein